MKNPELIAFNKKRKKDRKKKILELKSQGLTNIKIAEKLFLSPSTVNSALNWQKDTFTFRPTIEIQAYTESEAIKKLESINNHYRKII